jgi:hypothetical protein
VKSLTPAELDALTEPRLCIWCEQRLALVGEGSNYCEGCQEALRPQKYQREYAKLSDREQAAIEMQDQVDFEQEHRAGADVIYAPGSSDFGRPE